MKHLSWPYLLLLWVPISLLLAFGFAALLRERNR